MTTYKPSDSDYKMTIQYLEHQLDAARKHVRNLENTLKETIESYQNKCDHDFKLTRDYDGHTSKSCYTCTNCNYWTYMKPSTPSS